MLNNYFENAPTVGSYERKPSYEELHAWVQQLEKRLALFEAPVPVKVKEPKKKPWWKRFGNFIQTIVTPLFNTVSKFINSLARYKTAHSV